MSRIGAVVIGRNEGPRLRRCLQSVLPQVERVVYVDSGSKDDSVALAKSHGVEVLVLDPTVPFTAARGRNEGFDALLRSGNLDYVQFVDGDCYVEPDWIKVASAALEADPTLGLITGWRTEIHPSRNIFHAMCEVEWHRPAGDISVCGGDMIVRVEAFQAAGRFDGSIIASEDEEFCLRLTEKTGLRVRRIPYIMTRHDVNMTRFQEWWRRHVRAGHGFAEVGYLYPAHFRKERLRAWVYGLGLPLIAFTGLLLNECGLLVLVAFLYGVNWARTAVGLRRTVGLSLSDAMHQSVYLCLSKFPAIQGVLKYHIRRLHGSPMQIIEYK